MSVIAAILIGLALSRTWRLDDTNISVVLTLLILAVAFAYIDLKWGLKD